MERHLHTVAIMIEVTSRHTECTHFNYSLMPAVSLRCYEADANIVTDKKLFPLKQRNNTLLSVEVRLLAVAW